MRSGMYKSDEAISSGCAKSVRYLRNQFGKIDVYRKVSMSFLSTKTGCSLKCLLTEVQQNFYPHDYLNYGSRIRDLIVNMDLLHGMDYMRPNLNKEGLTNRVSPKHNTIRNSSFDQIFFFRLKSKFCCLVSDGHRVDSQINNYL